MENEPKPEKRIEKSEVIAILKETKDFNNPVVQEWLNQKEGEVSKEGTARARILYNIELTDLYVATENINGCFEHLKELEVDFEADLSLSEEEVKELYEAIHKKMEEVNYPKNDRAIGIDPKIQYGFDKELFIKNAEWRAKILEALGYEVLDNNLKYLRIKKYGNEVIVGHYPTPSTLYYNKGKISEISIVSKDPLGKLKILESDGIGSFINSGAEGHKPENKEDEEIIKMIKEIVDNIN